MILIINSILDLLQRKFLKIRLKLISKRIININNFRCIITENVKMNIVNFSAELFLKEIKKKNINRLIMCESNIIEVSLILLIKLMSH